jgi:hypothetical protein
MGHGGEAILGSADLGTNQQAGAIAIAAVYFETSIPKPKSENLKSGCGMGGKSGKARKGKRVMGNR